MRSLRITADTNANQNSATSVDLIVVYDASAVAVLPKNAPDWFEQKQAIVRALAGSLDVISLQVPPATAADVPLPTRVSKACAIFCAVNYVSASGQRVMTLTPYRVATVRLEAESVECVGE